MSLQRLPRELQYSIAIHLPLSSLANLFASAPRSLSTLHGLTIRNPAFAPYRRRYEIHHRLYQCAYRGAELRAIERERKKIKTQGNDAEPFYPDLLQDKPPQSQDFPKASSELEYEAVLVSFYSDYGISVTCLKGEGDTTMGGVVRDSAFTKLDAPRLFAAIARMFNEDYEKAIVNKQFLRLRKLGCELPELRRELKKILELEDINKWKPLQPKFSSHPHANIYYLLTVYLLYTELTPQDVPGIVRAATPSDLRDARAIDDGIAISEYFYFLLLYLDMWDAQNEVLDDARSLFNGVIEVLHPTGEIFDHASRRVLKRRLKVWVDKRYAPAKPFWVDNEEMEESDDAPPVPILPASRSGRRAMPFVRSTSLHVPPTSNSVPSDTCKPSPRLNLKRSASMCNTDIPKPGVKQTRDSLTDEQRRMVDTDLLPGELMKVRAYAGTGKTRSLVEYAKKRPSTKFLYVAFNKNAAVDAAKKFGYNVDCKTIHAVALGVLRKVSPKVAAAKEAGAMSIPPFWGPKDIIKIFELEKTENLKFACDPSQFQTEITSESGSTKKNTWPTPTQVANAVKNGLENFWNSALIDPKEDILPTWYISNHGLKSSVILQWIRIIWRDIYSGDARWLPHDAYVKLFHIARHSHADAFSKYDFIMFDEAQDANPCMADLLLRQRNIGKALIVVGDPYQKIYGFRGAGNNCFDDKVFPPTHLSYLTHSFRFGDNIASVANILLAALSEPVPVHGVRPTDIVYRSITHQSLTTSTPPFTIIFRKNLSLISHTLNFGVNNPQLKLHLRIQKQFNKSTLFASLRYGHALFHHDARAPSGPLRAFSSWSALKDYIEHSTRDPSSESPIPALIYALGDEHFKESKDTFLDILAQIESNVVEDPSIAHVTFVTAHQAKGLEWDRVQVFGDFAPDYSERSLLTKSSFWQEELGILYVAVTRARKQLSVSLETTQWIAAATGARRWVLSRCRAMHGAHKSKGLVKVAEWVLPRFEGQGEASSWGPQSFRIRRPGDDSDSDSEEEEEGHAGGVQQMTQVVHAVQAPALLGEKMWIRQPWDVVWKRNNVAESNMVEELVRWHSS